MRFQLALLALPSIAVAVDQQPLGGLADQVKGWFKQAQSFIDKNVPNVVPSPSAQKAAQNPVKTATDKAKDALVTHLTLDNWKDVLRAGAHSKAGQPEEWLVYLTGANKTCYGLCGRADTAWKEAVPILSANPKGPQLAEIDCEEEQLLCNSWAAGPPTVYTIFLQHPQADQSVASTPVYSNALNRTSVTAMDIVNIHTKQEYKKNGPYEGAFHPFDGVLAKYGLAVPIAYVMWGLAKMPSWLPMVAISLLSRTFMSRRMGGQQSGQGGAQGGAAPAPAPAR